MLIYAKINLYSTLSVFPILHRTFLPWLIFPKAGFAVRIEVKTGSIFYCIPGPYWQTERWIMLILFWAKDFAQNWSTFILIPFYTFHLNKNTYKYFHFSVKKEPTDEPSSPLEATSPGSILRNNNGECLRIIMNDLYEASRDAMVPHGGLIYRKITYKVKLTAYTEKKI